MALNFPTSPELNQVYTSGTRSWRWDGSSWVANNSVTNILGYIPVNKAGDTMSGGLNVPNVNAVTVTANSGGFSIAGGSSASKTLTVSNSVTVSGTDGSTLNIGAGGTLQSGAFQVSSQGTTGATGAQGTTGAQGATGTQGANGTQGTNGAQGTTGTNGIQGATGSQGANGSNGAQGSTGATGSQGSTGATGSQGSTGTQGAVGSTGGTGATGGTGVQGATGAQGSTGATGSTGSTGATGAQGTSGATILGSNNTWTGSNTFNGGLSSGSVITAATGASGGFQNAGYAGGRNRIWSFGNADAYGISYFQNVDSSDWIGMHFGNTTSYSNSQFYVSTGGNTWASTSSRAPIFYDSNDTAYYCDPASTSRLNAITYTNMYSSASSAYGFFGNNVYVDTVNSGGVGDPLELCYARGAYTTTSGSMRAPIFYDSDDTGYYLNPNGGSYLYSLILSGNGYFRPQTWIQMDSSYGMYWPNTNGAHLHANASSSYGSIMIQGSRNGWRGIYFYDGGYTPHYMLDGSGNGGLYFESSGRWANYHSYPNNCTGFGTSTTNSAYNIYCPTGVYSGGRVDGTIFYDSNNTGYYIDGNNTSNLYALTANSTFTVNNGWSYLANNYGYGVVGLYDSTIFQLVFAMGNSYKTTAGGGINNLYGIAWSYPSAGGIAGNLSSHGLIVAINGGFGSCMSYNVTASGNVTAYSDERLKKDWADLPKDYVEQLAKVKVGTYTRIDGEKIRQVGISAQSLRPLLPEAVIESADDMKTLNVSYGNAAMASAVELAKEVVTLKEQLNIVMERLKQLENK